MKNQLALGLVAIVLVFVVGACAPPAAEEPAAEEPAVAEPDPVADEEALTAKSDEWQAFFNAGDGAAIAAMMTEDGMLMPPNAEPVSGHEAIGGMWQGLIETGVSAELRLTELRVDGDLAFKRGEYDLVSSEGEMVDTGKWVEIWIRMDHGWELHRDIWNSDLALPE